MCSACGIEKPLDPGFPVRRKRPDGHEGRCRACLRAGNRRHYQNDPTRRTRLINERKQRLRTRLLDYLGEHPCVDCGEADIIVLQFDHCYGIKTTTVAETISRGWSWAMVLTEIAKCEVVCANCHMRRTARRAGWPRVLHGRVAQSS